MPRLAMSLPPAGSKPEPGSRKRASSESTPYWMLSLARGQNNRTTLKAAPGEKSSGFQTVHLTLVGIHYAPACAGGAGGRSPSNSSESGFTCSKLNGVLVNMANAAPTSSGR